LKKQEELETLQKEQKLKKIQSEKDIFEDIYGHDHLKTIFKNVISGQEPVHVLLNGAPGSSKSLFLEAIAANVENSCLITNNSTGAGIIQTLFNNPNIEFLLIDELEKIGKIEQSGLLTLRRMVV
jgi:replication-associated recombination protein RarA